MTVKTMVSDFPFARWGRRYAAAYWDNRVFDIAIIGAGITGACIAREASRTTASVVLLDKENDAACGSSKANSGIIHAGYDPLPGTLMARLNVRGNKMYGELAEKLHFELKHTGSLVLAFDDAGVEKVKVLLERGNKNGVEGLRIVEGDELHKMEPGLGSNVKCALYAPTACVVNPYQATWAFAESAVINGVTFMRGTAVHGIERDDSYFILHTGRGNIRARYVVNAAGCAAAKISKMAGCGRKFDIKERRGEYCLLDKKCKVEVNSVLFQTPTALGKGVLITRTADGNLLVGPSADDQDEIGDTATHSRSIESVLKAAELTIANIPKGDVINTFAGIRALATEVDQDGKPANIIEDFIIEEDSGVPSFINAAGICSPGLSSAPAIAEYVMQLLGKAGLDTSKRTGFIEERQGIESFALADTDGKKRLIKKDKRYGHIICRCEEVTEAEVVAAVRSPLGARDVDGVKRRTRAGMGRCQGGFCLPLVTAIIARETGIPMENVTKKGGSSFILEGRSR